MSTQDASIALVLAEHAGYEWWPMTREFICTCEASIGTSYPHLAHRAHVAAALAAAGIGVIATAKADVLRESARYFEYEMAPVWGGDATWISTGAHVADLVAEHLRDRAATLESEAVR